MWWIIGYIAGALFMYGGMIAVQIDECDVHPWYSCIPALLWPVLLLFLFGMWTYRVLTK